MDRWKKARFQKTLQKDHMQLKKKVTGGYDRCDLSIEQILGSMTFEEKLDFISGVNNFCIRGIDRLKFNEVWTTDATCGPRGWDEEVTIFPAPIAMAATFNRDLIGQVSHVICKETRAVGASILLAPGVTISRVPTCGRNFEYFGEDPYLSGQMAESYIKSAKEEGVITTCKHFACNNSDYDRHKSDSTVDERTLNEIYFPAFKKAVESGTLGIMTSYNLVNGVHASQNDYLINEVLRKKWGYKGFIISDWDSIYSTVDTVKHGVDLEMPAAKFFGREKLLKALDEKKITIQEIEEKILNILNVLKKAGVLDRKINDSSIVLHSEENKETSYDCACEAITLLKNEDDLLPLDKSKVKNIVLLGKNIDQCPAGGGSSQIIPVFDIKTLKDQIGEESDITISYFESKWYKNSSNRKIVSEADAVIIQTGFDYIDESECYDRDYEFSKEEKMGIQVANNLNKKVLVIVNSGGAFDVSWIEATPAVMLAYYLGEQGSRALFDIIFGKISPSGKLPFTIAKKLSHWSSMENYYDNFSKFSLTRVVIGQGNPNLRKPKKIEYKEGLLVGYRDFTTRNIEPEFCFGHGLSYSSFKYSDLEMKKKDGKVSLNFKIKNTGKIEAKETCFVFVHPIKSKVFRPSVELKGFEKIALNVGEEKIIKIKLGKDAFSYYSEQIHDWIEDDTVSEIMIGSSLANVCLRGIV
ncbi:MAG: beta-glucosidase [Sphaerochaetaceae bacterium]